VPLVADDAADALDVGTRASADATPAAVARAVNFSSRAFFKAAHLSHT
jgi:hypothetical protein